MYQFIFEFQICFLKLNKLYIYFYFFSDLNSHQIRLGPQSKIPRACLGSFLFFTLDESNVKIKLIIFKNKFYIINVLLNKK